MSSAPTKKFPGAKFNVGSRSSAPHEPKTYANGTGTARHSRRDRRYGRTDRAGATQRQRAGAATSMQVVEGANHHTGRRLGRMVAWRPRRTTRSGDTRSSHPPFGATSGKAAG